ncbi:MAG TPA: histidinol-phosphatase [Chryseosolibacter sp.]|nr:histidinol-phosphatase [Chryseosolibacter sp.]
MKRNLIPCLLTVLVIAGCTERETDGRKWYKGNLHTHSYWSDGDEFPEMIMDWYKSHDYDFVSLTDHNILAQGEKWVVVRRGRLYEEAFENYLAKFGEEWVTFKRDTGRVQVRLKTYDEYRTLFEDENFLIIRAEEISDRFEGKPIHINATNLQALVKPQGGNSVTEVMQRNVDAVLKQRQETGVPMFPHINHPNFHFAITAQDLIGLRGERFFEVYNGHPQVYNYGDSTRPGTEYIWDEVNMAYYRKNQPYLYGLATDDTHNYHQLGSQYSNAGRGWVMVRSDSLTPSSLIEAMERGDFYATTGVILDDISVRENVIHVDVKEEEGVKYEIQFIGATGQDQQAKILEKVEGPEATFELRDSYIFVRAKILSDKPKENPFQEGDVEMAWTQPVRGDQ